MTDGDIQFGELEETTPERMLRPDENRHYAVVACGEPRDGELPVYVDLDAMRDMELHALTNTRVELGGVMLGGQYYDEQGRPFVVVTDSLRAQHYEATKGSFKFTHDTWEQITRERDEFPDELQMVGWYHTHPDWGVFLSGMDMFICDNFFNKPLDVALVIDPCRDDRGWFQWTGDVGERVRRVGGFYLVASRFRRDELEAFAVELEGQADMSRESRLRSGAGSGAPIIHVHEPRPSPWLPIATLGMLMMQFVLVVVLLWRVVTPEEPPAEPSSPAAPNLEAQRELLDQVVGTLEVAPEGLVTALETERRDNERLRVANDALVAQVRTLEEFASTAETRQQRVERDLAALRDRYDRLQRDMDVRRDRIRALERELGKDPDEEGEAGGWSAWLRRYRWYLAGAGLALIALGVLAAASRGRNRPEDEPPLDDGIEPSPDADQHER